MEISLEFIGTIVTILIGLGVIVGVLLHYERRHTKIEVRVDGVERRMDNVEEQAKAIESLVFLSKNPDLIEMVKGMGPSVKKKNPYDPREKVRLLERYRTGTLLDIEEARRLQGMLKEDAAQTGGNVIAAIAIAILLIGLGALIAYLLGSE